MKRFLVFFLAAATLAFSLCSCSKPPFGRPAENAVPVTERTESPTHTGGAETSEKEVVPQGVSGAWVSTVANIDFPSSPTLGADELKKEIDSIISDAETYGLNALFLQVRPCADAIYPSKIFPSSAYICGKQGGKLPLDVLDYFITAAHAKNIDVHAWINPYRVTCASSSGYNEDTLAAENPAVLHPEWVVRHSWTENGIRKYACFFNPALPEVRKLICDGVEELIANYDIDGIHFDDYFYPYADAASFDDGEAYDLYGNGMPRDDWRRANVNALIEQVHGVCAGRVVFGVSPCGVWARKSEKTPSGTEGIGYTVSAYSDVYADVYEWIENGRIDYVCPQLYWQISHSSAPFCVLADWWNDVCGEYGVTLYIGIGAYRGAESGAYSSPDEIASQIAYANGKENCKGVVFFSFRSLRKNYADVQASVKVAYEDFAGG